MKTSGFRRIAERYVRALFDVAQGASALDAVENDLKTLADALHTNAELREFFYNPLFPADARGNVLLALLDKVKGHKITRQFIGLLVAQKRLEILPQTAALFIEWASAARGEMNAELVSAAPLKDKEVKLVTDRLSKVYGRKMNLEVRHNPALLGGVILKIGSIQLDSSLAGKMDRLKIALQAA